MGKYVVSIPVKFDLYTVIEANSREEALDKAKKIEPSKFLNFYSFYEWLGSEWDRLIEKVEVYEV